jgi:hypothetical protein
MVRAASELLGPGVAVRTAAFPDQHPESVDPTPLGEESATLEWDAPAHEHAHLRFCRYERACSEHWLTFNAADPESERGRTLGFLLASLFAQANPTPAPAPAPARALPRSAPVPQRPEFPRTELSAAVAAAGPGDGSGLGVRVAGAYATSREFRAGVGAEVRFGDLPDAEASTRIGAVAAQGAWLPWRPFAGLSLGGSASAGAYYLSISHFSSDDRRPDRQGRFLPGGTLTLVAALDLGHSSSVVLELGAEVLGGRTTLVVREQVRAVWPIVTPLLRLGILAGF